jgi:hypothetical protein
MCSKKGFASYREAKEVMNYIKNKSNKNKIPKRIYKCKFCGEFHLTSQKTQKKCKQF